MVVSRTCEAGSTTANRPVGVNRPAQPRAGATEQQGPNRHQTKSATATIVRTTHPGFLRERKSFHAAHPPAQIPTA